MTQLQYTFPLLKKMKSSTQSISMIKKLSKSKQQLKISIVAWNLQGTMPPINSTKTLINTIISQPEPPQLICIATQQCQRSIGASFFCENKQQWEDCLRECCEGYVLGDSEVMMALHTAIMIRQDVADCFSTEGKAVMKAGICNMVGNKGAVSMVVNILGQNLQFINCHLQPHQDQCQRRNQVLLKIVQTLVQKDYRNQVFICGDLNYRIQMTHQQYQQLVKDKQNTQSVMQYKKLLPKDQLANQQILKRRFFPYYKQATITFPPTYKIGTNDQIYDKKRIPGWTDRIFHRKGRVRQYGYRCEYELKGTDHRPVVGKFRVAIEESLTMFADQFVGVKASRACQLI